MLHRLSGLLSETDMGLLALAALSIGLAPALFALAPGVEQAFDAAEWVIVGLFTLEYALRLLEAPDKPRFALDPWRVLDLLVILASVASVLPVIPDAVRASPALRILRLLRAILFGARARHLKEPAGELAPPLPPAGEPKVGVLAPEHDRAQPGTWGSLLQWAAAPTPGWWHVTDLSPQHLKEVAAAVHLPPLMLEIALHEASYPRLEARGDWIALSLSFPSTGDRAHRHPILLLVSEMSMLSLSASPSVPQDAPEPVEGLPWGPGCALHVIRQALRNEAFRER